MSRPTLSPEAAAACADDIRRFEEETAAQKNGTLPFPEYKGRRARHGTYEQRQDGRFMIRPRFPAGVLTTAAARAAAAASRTAGDGVLHLTTRQDVQIHGVPEDRVPGVMRDLLAAGVPCRGSGGDAARNTAACPLAGVCQHEAFDVTPNALAVGGDMLAAAGEFSLPRKFKPAFSGCNCDCAGAKIADSGFIARIHDGQPGFALYAGGGLGAISRPADLLEEWIPAADAPAANRALLKLFERHGDRTNRARARLRFVFERLGVVALRTEFRQEFAAARAVPPSSSPIENRKSKIENSPAAPSIPPSPWRLPEAVPACGLRIVRQRQEGLVSVAVRPPLGLLSAAAMACAADAAEQFSREKGLRLTPDQGFLIRSVPENALPELDRVLAGTPQTLPDSGDLLGWMTVCSGSSVCRLGQFDSRDLARSLAAALLRASLPQEFVEAADIRISGCLNACSQAPVAGIGLCGLGRPGEDGKIQPHYRILLGASRRQSPVRLNEPAAVLPAGRVPAAVVALLQAWRGDAATEESLGDFSRRLGPDALGKILA